MKKKEIKLNFFGKLILSSFWIGSIVCASERESLKQEEPFMDIKDRNAYRLTPEVSWGPLKRKNPLHTRGYEWWWHSFIGIEENTGEKQPFFIEYFVINPGLGGKKPILGQLQKEKPSYAMMKVGAWEQNNSKQIHNFYGIEDFWASSEKMDVRIGENIATDTFLKGHVFLSQEDSQNNREYMSDFGEMKWDLQVNKILSYSVGYGASEPFQFGNIFQMFWHVQGMKTEYSGEVFYNGKKYIVYPETSSGYQDKNWGMDYTNPWIWLSCNQFVRKGTHESLLETSLDVGGGRPVALGIPYEKKVLVAFYLEGKLYEFNFSQLWISQKQDFHVKETETKVIWDIEVENPHHKLIIHFENDKDKMLKINYENPLGKKKHQNLWNGHHGEGTLFLFEKVNQKWVLQEELEGSFAGVEYGEH